MLTKYTTTCTLTASLHYLVKYMPKSVKSINIWRRHEQEFGA